MSNTYECERCGHRTSADGQPGVCPECGDEMRNVSVTRE
ncbi:rubrerythrin-like domain-containing protein [Halomicrococcus gelatinilyticus]